LQLLYGLGCPLLPKVKLQHVILRVQKLRASVELTILDHLLHPGVFYLQLDQSFADLKFLLL
jgi:hypothetical protein